MQQIVIGAVLTREECYAFDAGSLKAGFPAWVRLSSHRRCLKRRLNKMVVCNGKNTHLLTGEINAYFFYNLKRGCSRLCICCFGGGCHKSSLQPTRLAHPTGK